MNILSEGQLVALIGAAPFLALSLIWLIHDSIQIARVIRSERSSKQERADATHICNPR